MGRFTRSTFAIILLGVLITFVDASPAAACSCAGTQADVAEMADAVFTGTVVEAESDPSDDRYLFEVDQVFKGSVHQRQWVDAGSKYAGCSTSFDGSGPWLILAEGTNELNTNFCMLSTPLDQATPDLLTNPTEPLDGTSPTGDDDTPPLLIFGGIAVAVAATAALLALASRQLRQHLAD